MGFLSNPTWSDKMRAQDKARKKRDKGKKKRRRSAWQAASVESDFQRRRREHKERNK